MWQAEVSVDLRAVRDNVAYLRTRTTAAVMAVVKADGYGHGMIPSARAAIAGGATWLGGCTIPEAIALRADGITVPILAWLWTPGAALQGAVLADIDLSVSGLDQLAELTEASGALGRTARVHLKLDTGLSRGGATA